MQPSDEAVLAGDLVALGELGNRQNLPLHLLQLSRQRPNPDDSLQLIAETLRIDLHGVAPEHAAFLQPAQAFGHTRRRQAADLRQGLERTPRILHQCADEDLINVISHKNSSIRRLMKTTRDKKGRLRV
ncbi:hypothetical protein D3C81_1801010 [compost metagenome]